MCGIVGGIADRNITPILLEGLRRLEYRGYDSAGLAVLDSSQQIQRVRALGKVIYLDEGIQKSPLSGQIGIAHTRWATHGVPSKANAHPHVCNDKVAIVHNGIIENYTELKAEQQELYRFTSDTDTETIAHQIDHYLDQESSLYDAVRKCVADLEGAFALGVIAPQDPDTLIAARRGSPLVIGVGIGEHFIASDVAALLPVTQRFIFLEEGDIALIRRDSLEIFDQDGKAVERPIKESRLDPQSVQLGNYRHYMHKEIFEQPNAVQETLEGRIKNNRVVLDAFGASAAGRLEQIESLQIIACGTSYHAGMVARYWFEDMLGIPCQVEVASEYRYRNPVIAKNALFLTLSQSGETADTLAALKNARARIPELITMTICNVPESSLIRESELTFLTHAGPEIGVASTKAFTTQLVALSLLMIAIGKVQKRLTEAEEERLVSELMLLPNKIQGILLHESEIMKIAEGFATTEDTLFLGRGTQFPIALEGALKLKEISYIHAEAYPAGELKHGPLALVDEHMPIVVVAPNDQLIEKLKANLQEVKARGGKMIIFADEEAGIGSEDGITVVPVARDLGELSAPILMTIPLQLLSYHVALIKGTDVDQPRNLAKSVTVE